MAFKYRCRVLRSRITIVPYSLHITGRSSLGHSITRTPCTGSPFLTFLPVLPPATSSLDSHYVRLCTPQAEGPSNAGNNTITYLVHTYPRPSPRHSLTLPCAASPTYLAPYFPSLPSPCLLPSSFRHCPCLTVPCPPTRGTRPNWPRLSGSRHFALRSWEYGRGSTHTSSCCRTRRLRRTVPGERRDQSVQVSV